ncbi:uncharacterized protein LOC122535233 [Frieseomelitta varia]|uniref:uncharacterized protein LOC122535233 n=1 Tax=Frieseomelitta varia TaxID=561572 RepID=UPI001CB6AE14|nr:uncharacterized protein LOC122535233 [Frieseomelitta varia]
MAEWEVALAVIAEPYRVPDSSEWTADNLNSVAIVRRNREISPPLRITSRGAGYVTTFSGGISVTGIYAPPIWPLEQFERLLDELHNSLAPLHPRAILVLGDFNAKSTTWGSSRTDARGKVTEDWATSLNLTLLNKGKKSTCVRWQGESIIDLTWASPSAARLITDWDVNDDVEILNDHMYITMRVALLGRLSNNGRNSQSNGRERNEQPAKPPAARWALRKMDMDLLIAAAHIAVWLDPPIGPTSTSEENTKWLCKSMTGICNMAMPRIRTH